MLLENILKGFRGCKPQGKSVRSKISEKKPVQEKVEKLTVHTLFLEQTKLACIYEWHKTATSHCFARVKIQGKSILRLQVEKEWEFSEKNLLRSLRWFELSTTIEYVDKVPTNDVWD